ncbi:hypothetical protein B0O99DRAFT_679773 [Bisporella sp. PMI_857]|nr:hypothetical protein B0O99DRAFT_679773 [Bisporella sp. PMI_857]
MSRFRGKKASPLRTNTGSIRGVKISAPIPFPDDEFPIREPGTGIATPLGDDGHEKQLQLSNARPDSDALPAQTTSVYSEETAEGTEATPIAQSSREPPEPVTQVVPAIQPSSSPSSAGKPQRKKSTLGGVFRKLFGKKPKNNVPAGSGTRAEQHRSDPTALGRSPKENALSQQRSASLPINEYNRALRSHSVVLDDKETRDSVQSIRKPGMRQRRSTTPSRLWTPNRAPGYEDWTGLSPRPASSHARDSRYLADVNDEEPIGVAVTCHPNRRSRSLGELRETMMSHQVTRRRSDEIRYWRESYDPGLLSPMSSNKADAEGEEPINIEGPPLPEQEPEKLTQPFNFGPLGEMAGMKITQAASLESRVLRLEKRVNEVDKVLSRMHTRSSTDPLILQDPPSRTSRRGRSGSGPRPKTDESEISLPNNHLYRGVQQTHPLHPKSQFRSSSYGSTRPSTTSTTNSQRMSFENTSHAFLSSTEPTELSTSRQNARPLSTSTTIRGVPSSSPTHSKGEGLTGEHYTTLTNMILAEQAARQDLEAVVKDLQQQLYQQLQMIRASRLPLPGTTSVPGGGTFSTFDDSDEEGQLAHDDFRTPNEERTHFGDEIFGDVKSNIETTAPRTLSLSQMTLGKGAPPSMNF